MQRWRLTPTTIVFILFLFFIHTSCTLSPGRPLHARPWPLTFIPSFPTLFLFTWEAEVLMRAALVELAADQTVRPSMIVQGRQMVGG
ncbi:uncharacterized protein LY79DRAFT_537688 [Colletotrichum navitas]|uniref:Secreted protein n=1 Tax=Colletotrichum navitas TaxID=681940 RepID=A0AAD8Q9X7_9PEZI|nr:uncharacterized protein LY79DRAFT_537688 [Colletotrichum navitas]KAK1598627.1 hypothetical protein LY79DRAFT_537688 [Colletotrichum navitas]